MKIKSYFGILILITSIFQTSCVNDPQSDSWRTLARMKAEDYFAEPLQVKFAEAVARGNADEIGELIKQGADVNALGRDGMRPLSWAMAKNSLRGFEFLLQNGADANLAILEPSINKFPLTLLEFSASSESSDYLRLLLKYKGNPNTISSGQLGDRTIIFDAIMHNQIENARVLIEAGADINQQDSSRSSPIMTAASINNYDMVYLLLIKGANPLLKDRWGFDFAGEMKRYGSRGIKPDSEEYQWYLKVVEEMKKRGLLK
ncbi:MAG TPA: ankyrin repeat domain-containing protein [Opitutaceae bacterium]|jgi:ankyrin repeat protein|nr:ankyrin repeat domain-containing protein [Opitutaceae bacterium]